MTDPTVIHLIVRLHVDEPDHGLAVNAKYVQLLQTALHVQVQTLQYKINLKMSDEISKNLIRGNTRYFNTKSLTDDYCKSTKRNFSNKRMQEQIGNNIASKWKVKYSMEMAQPTHYKNFRTLHNRKNDRP